MAPIRTFLALNVGCGDPQNRNFLTSLVGARASLARKLVQKKIGGIQKKEGLIGVI